MVPSSPLLLTPVQRVFNMLTQTNYKNSSFSFVGETENGGGGGVGHFTCGCGFGYGNSMMRIRILHFTKCILKSVTLPIHLQLSFSRYEVQNNQQLPTELLSAIFNDNIDSNNPVFQQSWSVIFTKSLLLHIY